MARKSHGGDYPANWNEIAKAVKKAAGFCCELVSDPICPIELDMAGSAECNQIRESIRRAVTLYPKFSERANVSNGQFLHEICSVFTANLAGMVISMACFIALLFPVWSVIRHTSATPMGTVLGAKMGGKPLKAAYIPTKALGRLTCAYRPGLSAHLARVHNPVGLTSIRTVFASNRMAYGSFINPATSLAGKLNEVGRLGAFYRTILLVGNAGRYSAKLFPANLTPLYKPGVFTGRGTIFSSTDLGGKFLKFLTTA